MRLKAAHALGRGLNSFCFRFTHFSFWADRNRLYSILSHQASLSNSESSLRRDFKPTGQFGELLLFGPIWAYYPFLRHFRNMGSDRSLQVSV